MSFSFLRTHLKIKYGGTLRPAALEQAINVVRQPLGDVIPGTSSEAPDTAFLLLILCSGLRPVSSTLHIRSGVDSSPFCLRTSSSSVK